MANIDRRQNFVEHHDGRLRNSIVEVKTGRRRTTDNHDRARDHDHDSDHDVEAFTTGRRATHHHIDARSPSSRYRQSTARQQRVPTREEYHDDTFQEHLHTYKTQLVDNLNARMSHADDETTQRMDELSEEFEDQLKIIEEAGGRFWAGIGEEIVEIGETEDMRTEIALQQVMTDLETLMEEKRARLKVLTVEYTRIRQEFVKLAITILGEEKVSFVGSDSNEQIPSTTKPTTKSTPSSPYNKITNLMNTETDTDTTTPNRSNDSFERVYDEAEAGLTDLQGTLDEIVARNLEENKGALKAFQTGQKAKQGELSKLLSSWSLS